MSLLGVYKAVSDAANFRHFTFISLFLKINYATDEKL